MNVPLKEPKDWDKVTITITIFAIIVLCFSFFAPFIFTSSISKNIFYFDDQTGFIGDTIGGIISPFIALVGILLTFLAFYMQIIANKTQVILFNKGIINEKVIRDFKTKTDLLNKLNLLKIELKNIIRDIEKKSQSLKIYYEEEANHPFKGNNLNRTTSLKYQRILEIDRLSIFNAFNLFLNHRKNWITEFNEIYNTLEFVLELFNDIYKKYENHASEKYSEQQAIKNNLKDLMNNLASLIQIYNTDHPNDYLNYPVPKLANATLGYYYKIISENLDKHGVPNQETDFEKLNISVLEYFILESITLSKICSKFSNELFYLKIQCSDIRKNLGEIKLNGISFSNNLALQYEILVVDTINQKSPISKLNEIYNMLDEELSKIKIEEIVV
jgi:hypothetical protein